MGVTVPMKILITDSRIAEDPLVKQAVEALVKQGHEVIVDDHYRTFDFICGGNCWYLKPSLANLFMLAITNARKVAHEDQERVQSHKLAQATKRKSAAARKTPRKKPDVASPDSQTTGGA